MNQYILSLNSTFVARAENWCVCCVSNSEFQTDLRKGFDFEELAPSPGTDTCFVDYFNKLE